MRARSPRSTSCSSTNRAAIGELIASAGELAKEGKTTLGKVNAGLGDGRPIASLLANADATLATAQHVARDADAGGRGADDRRDPRHRASSPSSASTASTRPLDNAATAAGRAGTLLDNANGMVTDLRAGKGTAGALLSRDDLYSDLRELIRDLKRNPWKFFWKE